MAPISPTLEATALPGFDESIGKNNRLLSISYRAVPDHADKIFCVIFVLNTGCDAITGWGKKLG
jgi:hypothetical protein